QSVLSVRTHATRGGGRGFSFEFELPTAEAMGHPVSVAIHGQDARATEAMGNPAGFVGRLEACVTAGAS
ncbi:MAG: hypothetical protein JXQ73_32520, partial [Phycisphaerae bacterium]|nr:hypothetical protein [Phycisphaerae bacterium]